MNSRHDPSTLGLETALRESEELFRTLCSHAPVGIFMNDVHGKCTYINEFGIEIMGVPREQAIQTGWLKAIHPDDRGRVEKRWTESLETGTDFSSEYRFQHPRGSVVWVQGDFAARWNDQGESMGFIGTVTNITARKEAEHFLELENQLLESAARGLPFRHGLHQLVHFIEDQAEDLIVSVMLVDADGMHLRHGAAQSLSSTYNNAVDGLAIAEGAGSCGTAVFRGESVYVTDIESDPLWERYRELARSQGLRACWSTPITDPYGLVLGTLAVYRRVIGGPTRHHRELMDAAIHIGSIMLTRHRDERDLRESESRFRTIFEQAAVGVAQLNSRSGEILRVNQRYCDILGSSADELVGKTWMDLTHPDDLDADLSRMQQLLAGEIREFTIEKRLHRQDESFVWTNLTVSAMWRPSQPPTTHIAILRDITKRKDAEEQLRLTKFSVDSCSTSIFWIRRDASFLYVNDAAVHCFGFSHQEWLSMTVHDVDPAYPAEVWPQYWAAMQQKQSMTFETQMRPKEGDLIPVEITTNLLEFEGEELVFAFVTDISQRKRMAESLRINAERLDLALSINNDGMFDWDLENDRVYFDDRYYTMAGYKPGEFPSSYEEWAKRVHPEDLAPVEKVVNAYLAGGLLEYVVEFRFRRKDGDWMWICARTQAVDQDQTGKTIRLVGTHTDITERKQAEETLEFQADILNQVSDAVMVTDREGKTLTYANQVAEKLFQISKRPGQSLPDLHDEILVSGPASDVIRAALEETGIWQGENEFRINNQTYTMETKLKAFQLPGSSEPFLMSVVRDISPRAKAELERRQHRDALAHMTRLSTMGEMVAGIAHEVKQPLYAIGNFATAASISLQSVEPTDPIDADWLGDLIEFSGGVRRASQRANEIIGRLREFARKGEQQREKIDINRVVHDSIDLVAFEARQCETVVETELDDRLPEVVADRIQCEQVVVNLLHNAYEALAKQGAPRRVIVRTGCSGGRLEIQVEDNGPGIPPDQQRRLFEAFCTTKPNGMGMGLAISRTIVEDHGGRLWVSCDQPSGATFHVTLPVAAVLYDISESP